MVVMRNTAVTKHELKHKAWMTGNRTTGDNVGGFGCDCVKTA